MQLVALIAALKIIIIIPRVVNSCFVKYLSDTMTLNQNQLQISCPIGALLPVHVTGMILVLRKMEQRGSLGDFFHSSCQSVHEQQKLV